MSGGFKYLGSLNPVLFYTFDRDNTFVLGEDVYYTNRTDYDAPMLKVEESSIFSKSNPHVNVITPALSLTETMSRYKSFSSGNVSLDRIRAYSLVRHPTYEFRNFDIKTYFNRDINYSSRYAKSKMGDGITQTIRNKKVYSMIMHVDFRYMFESGNDYNNRVKEYYGNLYQERFYGNRPEDMTVKYYINDNLYNLNDNTIVFKLFDVELHANPIDKDTISLLYRSPNITPRHVASVRINTLNIIYLEIDIESGNISLRFNNNESLTVIGRISRRENTFDDIQFGFKTSIALSNPPFDKSRLFYEEPDYTSIVPPYIPEDEDEVSIEDEYVPIDLPDGEVFHDFEYGMGSSLAINGWVIEHDVEYGEFHRIYTTGIELRFDNVAVFDRALTFAEYRRYYSLHNDIITHYKQKGFIELYDFKYLYDSMATRYLSNNEFLYTNLINGMSNMWRVRTTGKYDDVYVSRHHEEKVEYSLHIGEKAMLHDMATSSNHPRFIRHQNFSISFMFRTTDDNGMLFSCVNRIPLATNLYLRFTNGYLEIIRDAITVKLLMNLNDGRFHSVMIVNTTGGSSVTIDNKTEFSTPSNAFYNSGALCTFGNSFPHMKGLEFDLAMLAYANRGVSSAELNDIYNNTIIYESSGVITLNNIRVGTTILIYNDHTGELIEKIRSDSVSGVFRYFNRYPYTITVIVNDDSLVDGRSYIVSPVEII